MIYADDFVIPHILCCANSKTVFFVISSVQTDTVYIKAKQRTALSIFDGGALNLTFVFLLKCLKRVNSLLQEMVLMFSYFSDCYLIFFKKSFLASSQVLFFLTIRTLFHHLTWC